MYTYITLFVVVLLAGGFFFWRWASRQCEQACCVDWGSTWLNHLDGLNRIFCRSFHKLRHDSIALRPDGGVLLASNHVSGLDPLLMVAACTRPLRFIIAREQYERWWLRWLFKAIGCIPVDRKKNSRNVFRVALEALRQGEVVVIFPHGGIHLSHQPPVRLKRGVALLARLASVPVHPLCIEGVRGQGMTIAAVLIPSRAKITIFESIHFDEDISVGMQQLAKHIGGIATAQE